MELRHRVIVGKPERQTPTVRATIRALNFFPYWRVPESVAHLDLIPRLVKEPGYLQQERIRVLTGSFNGPEVDSSAIDWRQADAKQLRFRQDPGPQNALGLVRIDMPNEHGVYMHDTPLKPLFNQRSRAFSAGCVRVQDVFTLVEWIAKYEAGWDQPGRAQDVIATGQALDLTLTRPLPVYFTYITAWAELDGRIIFRPDIYGRDGVRDLWRRRSATPTTGRLRAGRWRPEVSFARGWPACLGLVPRVEPRLGVRHVLGPLPASPKVSLEFDLPRRGVSFRSIRHNGLGHAGDVGWNLQPRGRFSVTFPQFFFNCAAFCRTGTNLLRRDCAVPAF